MKEDGSAPASRRAPASCLGAFFASSFAGNVHMSSFHPLTHAISAKEVR
jgi:hypothetical protein